MIPKIVFVINFVENYDIIHSAIGVGGGRRGVFRETKRKTKFKTDVKGNGSLKWILSCMDLLAGVLVFLIFVFFG